MGYRPGTGRRHVDQAGVSLGISDEFANRLCRKGRVHLHDVWPAEHACHWRYVAKVVEAEIRIERSVDRICRAIEEQRVPVRRCPDDDFGPEIAPRAAPVFDDEWLPQSLRQLLTH